MNDSHEPRSCSKCSQPLPVNLPDHCGGTGYVGTGAGNGVCYPCADKLLREELLDRSKPFVGYVSSDGKSITSWTGGRLMDVTRSQTVRLVRFSYIHGNTIQNVRARDVHGGEWVGRGSSGVAIKLRPVKS